MKLKEQINLENIFDTFMFGMIIMNDSAEILNANQSVKKLLGWTGKEPEQNLSNFISIQDVSKILSLVNKKINDHVQTSAIAFRTSKTLEIDISPSFRNDIKLWVLIIKDITEKVKLVKELEHQETIIQKAEKQLEKEQELSDLKSKFISIASHEFRTPLSGILSSINLVERYLGMEDSMKSCIHSPKIDNHFGKIKSSINNLTLILNQFLSISRIQDDNLNFNLEEVDIEDLFKDILSQMLLIKKSDQYLELEIEGDKFLHSEPNILRIIFSNIISNSIKYSGNNGQIKIKVNNNKEMLTVSVEDNGIGIPENEQKNIFKRFYRASNATNYQGTGLGLHIIKKYIETLRGEILLVSENGNGTTVSVNIKK